MRAISDGLFAYAIYMETEEMEPSGDGPWETQDSQETVG